MQGRFFFLDKKINFIRFILMKEGFILPTHKTYLWRGIEDRNQWN